MPTVSYSSVREAIINYMQKTFKNGQDMAKSIKQMKKIDLTTIEPELSISNVTNEDARTLEQASYNIKYQKELRRHMD